MIQAADIQQVLQDFGTHCRIIPKDESAARPVFMVLNSLSSGSIHTRHSALSFVDKSSLPPGADWAYGLLLAGDAPEGMKAETRLTFEDSKGGLWSLEAAKPIDAIEDGIARVLAWRLALRGKQRGPGGK